MENSVEWYCKSYSDLSKKELYNILQLRLAVFVVEQNCTYQDIDGKDEKALHVIGVLDNKIVAYARCFDKGAYYEKTSFGRVIIHPSQRGKGLGYQLIEKSIEAIKTHFNSNSITISAQKHLEKFYQSFGFCTLGEPYLEDGIPHIKMVLNLESMLTNLC